MKSTFASLAMLAVFVEINLQSQSFIANPQPALDQRIGFAGSFGNILFQIDEMTISGRMDLDLDARMATFRRMSFHLDSTHSFSRDFEIGGQTNTISGSITFDSTIDFLMTQPIPMTEESSNLFSIGPETGIMFGSSDQMGFSGTYEFSLGSIETVSGTFSFNPDWESSVGATLLNTEEFPDRLVVGDDEEGDWQVYFARGQIDNIIEENIGGVDVHIDFANSRLKLIELVYVIPEPSIYAFAIGMLLIGFIVFRRRCFAKC